MGGLLAAHMFFQDKLCGLNRKFNINRSYEYDKIHWKIYFWDTGVRNAVIRNFNPLYLRQDIGGLWENFLVAERLKTDYYAGRPANYWFWRTHAQQEIDYIEERNGLLSAWEFKWKATKPPRVPKSFLDAYPGCITGYVTPDIMEEFLLGGEQPSK